MTAERTAVELLAEAGARLCNPPVKHLLFREVRAALEAALRCYKLVLLVGVSGAGKTAVIEAVARDMNAPIVEDRKRIHAVVLETLSPSHNRFPWRDQLEAILDEIEDPLPARKIDREAYANGLDPKVRGPNASAPAPRPAYSSEAWLRKAVRDAARDRGLKLLVLDEAVDLVMGIRGRTLSQQLRVLRKLCSRAPFRIVLVSSIDLLAFAELKSDLNRRRDIVYVPGYGSSLDPNGRAMSTRGLRKQFYRVVSSLMRRLPEPSRMDMTSKQLRYLFDRTCGCVGRLAQWFDRAVANCVNRGSAVLDWEDFEESVEPDFEVDLLREQCVDGDERIRKLRNRTQYREIVACSAPAAEQGSLFDADAVPETDKASRSRRIGTPDPTRREEAIQKMQPDP